MPKFRRGLKRRSWDRQKLLESLRRGLDVKQFLRDELGVTKLEQNGPEITISCPLPFGLHSRGDQTPSARVNEEKLVYICYVCGGGDIIWLTQNVLDVERERAIAVLKAAMALREESAEDFLSEVESFWLEEDVNISIPEYAPVILNRWTQVHPYFTNRGISEEVQEKMQTGYDALHRDEIEGEWIQQPRVVVPHFFEGKLCGWSKRKLSDGQKGTKYRHSPGFPKSYTVYNYDQAIRHVGPVMVVESPLSVLKMMSVGFDNVVATFGIRVPEEQANLLKRFDETWVWFDGDFDGRNAQEELAETLDEYTKVWKVPSPVGKDPGDLTRDEMERCIARRVPSFVEMEPL